MSFSGFGEMIEGDFADMCVERFPFMKMGAKQRVYPAQTR